MDFKTFLENFDAIAEAPGGIPKLRRLILDLAMRGKLVAQNPDNVLAEPLHGKTTIEQDVANGDGGIKSYFKTKSINDKVKPLPPSWTFSKVEDLVNRLTNGYVGPTRDIYQDNGIPYLLARHVKSNHLTFDGRTFISEEFNQKNKKSILKTGDVLVVQSGHIGESAVVTLEHNGHNCHAMIVITPQAEKLDGRFLSKYFSSSQCQEAFRQIQTGITLKHLNCRDVKKLEIPVPPLEEQKRIVEKVDELMGLCDRYEAAKQTRDYLRQKLRGSAIASLMDAKTDEELDAAWAFVRDNWQNLSQHSGDVSSLRQSILNLAIRGNLVCQQSEDEPAHKIFKEIQESKQLLYSNKKATKKKECLPFNDNEIPFSIPKTWKWVRLHELCWLISDGTHHTPTYVESGVPFLSVKNVSGGCLDFSNTRFITRETHEELCVRCKPEYGDILLTKVGTTGIAVEIDTHQEFSIFVSIALLKHFPEFTYPRFLQYLLNSSFVKAQSEAGTEGVGNKNLVLRKIYNFIVPLPPLAEQKRIVAKVDELMQLCDQLEASLRESQKRAESLAASAISHLTI